MGIPQSGNPTAMERCKSNNQMYQEIILRISKRGVIAGAVGPGFCCFLGTIKHVE